MMLHLGCGNVRIEQFVNIDCRPTEATDVVTAAWDLGSIPSESVEYIYARHMLEHLSAGDARRALIEWRRVLRAGGIVHIVVPDILFHARQLIGAVKCPAAADQERHALAGFYGWQNEMHGGVNEDAHRWGYTPASIEKLLIETGLQPTDDGIAQLIERDREPWHINIRAFKEGVNGVE